MGCVALLPKLFFWKTKTFLEKTSCFIHWHNTKYLHFFLLPSSWSSSKEENNTFQLLSLLFRLLSLLLKANKIFLFLDQKSVKKCSFPRHMLRFQTPLKPQNMTTTKEKQNGVAMLRKIENVFFFLRRGIRNLVGAQIPPTAVKCKRSLRQLESPSHSH